MQIFLIDVVIMNLLQIPITLSRSAFQVCTKCFLNMKTSYNNHSFHSGNFQFLWSNILTIVCLSVQPKKYHWYWLKSVSTRENIEVRVLSRLLATHHNRPISKRKKTVFVIRRLSLTFISNSINLMIIYWIMLHICCFFPNVKDDFHCFRNIYKPYTKTLGCILDSSWTGEDNTHNTM